MKTIKGFKFLKSAQFFAQKAFYFFEALFGKVFIKLKIVYMKNLPYFQDRLEKALTKLKNFRMKDLSNYKAQQGVAGLWEDEEAFLVAVRQARKRKIKNVITITPYPVHGLEEASGTPRSWIPWVTFTFGLLGCLFGLWFTWWTSAVDWPVIIGGKPHWSLAAFIPVIFELTILFAALSSIAALFYVCGLPHIEPPVIDPGLSSHKFGIFIPEGTKKIKDIKPVIESLKPKKILETEF
ncbi:MAG: DUF3341 domain-containing protein [Bdellovibrionales bacterium]